MPSWRGRLALALAPKEVRALTANDAIKGLWTAMNTTTGVRVDEKTSLQIISVFTAVKILSEGFSQVPLKVYRTMNNGESRTEMRDHPMYGLLHDWPNERMTAFAMREYWMMSLALWGNAYTQIIRNFRGEVTELWPLNPAGTRVERLPDGRIIYRTQVNSDPYGYAASAKDIVLEEDEVFHIRGFATNTLSGLSPIGMIRENVGLAAAYQEFAGRFFSNGGIPGFILSTDKPMQQQQLDLMHKEWAESYQGLTNSQKVAILHGGLKPEKIGIPMEDMQFIESRQFEREEIFSFYRIPPNFYSANRITSWGSGIKEMSVGFVKFTLDPWFVRVENAINAKFFRENAQGPIFPEFDREGFLRGDFPTRIQGYQDLFNMGVVSNRWIARTENLPDPPEEIYLVPSNMVPVDKIDAIADQQAAPPPAPVAAPAAPQTDNAANRAALVASQRQGFVDSVDRILRRATFDIGQAKQQKTSETPEDAAKRFDKWMVKFTQDHLGFTVDKLSTAFEDLAELVRSDVARETGKDIPQFPNFVRLRLEQAAVGLSAETEGNADVIVDRELMKLANDFAEVCYREAGIVALEPVTIDDQKWMIANRFVDKPETSRQMVVINQAAQAAPQPPVVINQPAQPPANVTINQPPPPQTPMPPPQAVSVHVMEREGIEELIRVNLEGEVKAEQIQQMIADNNKQMVTELRDLFGGLKESMAPQLGADEMRALLSGLKESMPAPFGPAEIRELVVGLRESTPTAPIQPPVFNLTFPKDAIKVEVAPAVVNINKGAVEVPITVHPATPSGDLELTQTKTGFKMTRHPTVGN